MTTQKTYRSFLKSATANHFFNFCFAIIFMIVFAGALGAFFFAPIPERIAHVVTHLKASYMMETVAFFAFFIVTFGWIAYESCKGYKFYGKPTSTHRIWIFAISS